MKVEEGVEMYRARQIASRAEMEEVLEVERIRLLHFEDLVEERKSHETAEVLQEGRIVLEAFC